MKKISIPLKLSLTYIVIMFAAIISGIFCLYSLYKYDSLDKEMTLKNIPCINLLKEGIEVSERIDKLSSKWLYLSDETARNELEYVINKRFKDMSSDLNSSKQHCTSKDELAFIKITLKNNNCIINNTGILLKSLSNFDDFLNETLIDSLTTLYKNNISAKLDENKQLFNQYLNQKIIRQNEITAQKDALITQLIVIVFCAVFTILALSILSVYYTKKHISTPLIRLRNIIQELSSGKVRDIAPSKTYDEISEMQKSLQLLIDGIKSKMKFAEEIGYNHLDNKLNLLSNDDSLGVSMNRMSENLKLLRNTSESLALSLEEAQTISKTGNWSMELKSGDFKWSKQLFQIFEIDMDLSFDKVIEEYKRKIPKEERSRIRDVFNDTVKTGEKYEYEHRIVLDDGRIKYIKGIGTAVRNENNRTTGIKGIVQDITAFKNVENELIKSKEKAENLSRAKDEFMSSMSHEIRTPLNGIIGFTEILLKDKQINPTQLQQLQAIKTSGDILLVIINDILDIAKIESGKMNIEEVPVNIHELIPVVLDTFSTKINEKELNLKIHVDSEIPTTILSDSVRLSQIILNFVSNAIKFTPEKGNIIVSASINKKINSQSYLKLSISDTGIGIPENKLAHIFEAVVQTENDTARKYGGTGLRLTIVKKIVDLMEGEVLVESTVGKGTSFIVLLPLKTEELTQNNLQNDKIQLSEKKREKIIETKSLNILLVEDNAINILLAQTVLDSLGFNVVTAENGKIALDILLVKEHTFDLILMDLMMPVLDGYEASIQIRSLNDENLKNIPIIALTADVTQSVKEKCNQIGINAYISKPFDSNELNELILSLTKEIKY